MKKMKYRFGDLNQAVDLSDLDFVLRYEQAVAEYEEGIKNLDWDISPSARLEQVCQLFFGLFDHLFGEGSSQKMFGETKSISLCTKAFTLLLRSMNKYAQELKNEDAA